MRSSMTLDSCLPSLLRYVFSLLIHFLFSFTLLRIMMFTWDTHVRLALLLVLPLTLLAYHGQSMYMVLMVLSMSVRWAGTQMP